MAGSILHSTVSPNLARELAVLARKSAVGFVDVGVSGGGPAAIEGKLTLFVGGEDADVERAKPWLDAIGKSIAHLGPVGKGQEAKLLNNLISIANYGMSAAIVDVATALGFERDTFIEALMSGSAHSFALKVAPGFVRKRGGSGSTSSFMGLHDLLKKDVDHCRELPPSDPVAMQALLASCEVMLARIKRAAAEAGSAKRIQHWRDRAAPTRLTHAHGPETGSGISVGAAAAQPTGGGGTGSPAVRAMNAMSSSLRVASEGKSRSMAR